MPGQIPPASAALNQGCTGPPCKDHLETHGSLVPVSVMTAATSNIPLSAPPVLSHLVKWRLVVSCDGLGGRHAQASGFYHVRSLLPARCQQCPSTPSALCDGDTALQPLGRDPATVTPLPAPHRRATRVSLHAQAPPPPAELNSPSPPAGQPFSPMTLYWQGCCWGLSQPLGPAARGSAWLRTQRLQNMFPVGPPGQGLLPLLNTVPSHWPCPQPQCISISIYPECTPPQALSPPLSPPGREHLNPSPSQLPSLIMAILYSPASVCGISRKRERGSLATPRGLRKRWEGSDFHVIIHFYKSRCQVHTGNTAVVLFS